ncbi:MAG: hypothetical protein EHM61_26835 [Acidobacteria bacterium]|nr:MAG: hypothetical protein EHM61_26835 [Acidobacteriota bacterium]
MKYGSKVVVLFPFLLLCIGSSARAQENSRPEQVSAKTCVCLAPARAQMVTGGNEDAVQAVRDTFSTFLNGPRLTVTALTARLESQVREEARQGECVYLLLTSLTHKRKGRGVFSKIATDSGNSTLFRIPAGSTVASDIAIAAATGAASGALRVAAEIKEKDELRLEYRLEEPDQSRVIVEKIEKAKASADGQDVLTPLVQKAAETIATAIREVGK